MRGAPQNWPLSSSQDDSTRASHSSSRATMRRRVLLLAVLVVLGLVGMFGLLRPQPAPEVPIGFLGFTNSRMRLEAVFGITNPPAAGLSLHSVRALSSGVDSNSEQKGHFSWANKEQWGMPYAITVHSTNEALRVVFQFQQRAVGPRRLVEIVRERIGDWTGNPRDFFTGHIFFVTNDIIPQTMTNTVQR